ncbi:HNH endonuclease [Tautonia plasticadhaerens]|uniref:HNH endonuclease n=1 Tax=Tautonia plasticadhaerens TaxID=2527974 RepID=A0A518H279_9BACT|nr:HNH endonuclease [Tautonia plasticadhaerens]QDV34952.1 HNH endonuclease [Tautonia plasticadhaerens]
MQHKARRRKRFFSNQKGRCGYCEDGMRFPESGKPHPLDATFDHLIPRARWQGDKGSRSRNSNLVLCCRDCNEAKANMTPREFLRAIWLLGQLPDFEMMMLPSPPDGIPICLPGQPTAWLDGAAEMPPQEVMASVSSTVA